MDSESTASLLPPNIDANSDIELGIRGAGEAGDSTTRLVPGSRRRWRKAWRVGRVGKWLGWGVFLVLWGLVWLGLGGWIGMGMSGKG